MKEEMSNLNDIATDEENPYRVNYSQILNIWNGLLPKEKQKLVCFIRALAIYKKDCANWTIKDNSLSWLEFTTLMTNLPEDIKSEFLKIKDFQIHLEAIRNHILTRIRTAKEDIIYAMTHDDLGKTDAAGITSQNPVERFKQAVNWRFHHGIAKRTRIKYVNPDTGYWIARITLSEPSYGLQYSISLDFNTKNLYNRADIKIMSIKETSKFTD